jgi:hypothetical protein
VETSGADWAVLTVTESLPADIEPLRLRRASAPSGTRAVLAGYGQDRAFALTADRDCELRDNFGAQLLRHTCRSTSGYSGAPILVSAGGNEVQVAGIQIATAQGSGGPTMLAVPAQAILSQENYAEIDEGAAIEVAIAASEVCTVQLDGENDATLHAVQARLDFDATVLPSPPPPAQPNAYTLAWLSFEPFAATFP